MEAPAVLAERWRAGTACPERPQINRSAVPGRVEEKRDNVFTTACKPQDGLSHALEPFVRRQIYPIRGFDGA